MKVNKINGKAATHNIWVIGDTHFRSHHMPDYYYDYYYKRVAAGRDYEIELKKLWNVTVKKNDTVYVLGDFSDYPHILKDDQRILFALHGYKTLVGGNHDENFKPIQTNPKYIVPSDPTISNNYWLEVGFERVLDQLRLNVNGIDVVFTHQRLDEVSPGCLNIHGHTHNEPTEDPGYRYYNVAAPMIGFQPINLFEIVDNYRDQLIFPKQE